MALRCAILDDYQNVALRLADWTLLGQQVELTVFDRPFADSAAAIAALGDFEIICAMRERTTFSREVIAALPKLKLLLTSGMRNAAIDLDAAKARGVVVCGTGATGSPTAGLAIGLMLELTRRIGFENARMKAGENWQITVGQDLENKVLGIVGLGKLGLKVAAVAQALGMSVRAWSTNLTPETCDAAGVGYASKDELFALSDIISIHLVLSERTRELVGRADLARMKPTSYLINTARGPLVDEAALLELLQQRRIAGAGLDTFSQEPLPRDHPLRRLDNVVLTPHLGYVTEENYRRFYSEMVADIAAWLKGEPQRRLA